MKLTPFKIAAVKQYLFPKQRASFQKDLRELGHLGPENTSIAMKVYNDIRPTKTKGAFGKKK